MRTGCALLLLATSGCLLASLGSTAPLSSTASSSPSPSSSTPSSSSPSSSSSSTALAHLRARREVPEDAQPAAGEQAKTEKELIIGYLHRYGYLSSRFPDDDELEEGLAQMQEVYGLPVTGVIDDETVRASRAPRCQYKDIETTPETNRRRRFVLAGASKWTPEHFEGEHDLHLKWYISRYTKDLPRNLIRSQVHKAFNLWSNQIELRALPQVSIKFEEASDGGEADIDISWADGDHGDAYKFDGTGGSNNVLAHTFFPDYQAVGGSSSTLNGDIHFDDAEKWSMEPEGNAFFPYVLAHEIGHALGLKHSQRQSAVMHSRYKSIPLEELELDIDDKCGVNWNYVGPSNFCLFVWLMSEIVPISNTSHGNMIPPDSLGHDRKNRVKGSLKNARIPRCLSTNLVQKMTAEKLMKSLHFAPEDARKYSQIACNFLTGLHVYRGSGQSSPDDSIETEFSSVHEFADSTRGVRRLVRRAERKQLRGVHTVLDPRHFTTHFYDRFFEEYFKLVR